VSESESCSISTLRLREAYGYGAIVVYASPNQSNIRRSNNEKSMPNFRIYSLFRFGIRHDLVMSKIDDDYAKSFADNSTQKKSE
jgi:hypothetical protein